MNNESAQNNDNTNTQKSTSESHEESSVKPVAPPPENQPANKAPSSDPLDPHKLMAVIGYIVPFLFFIPLINDSKDNAYARFHANQQLLLLLFWIIGQIAASMLVIVIIGFLLYPVVIIGGVLLMIFGILNALKGEMKPLPVIGSITLIK